MAIDRRAFLRDGALLLTGAAISLRTDVLWAAAEKPPALRIGLLTDCHYADRDSRGTRIYRESLAKIEEAVGLFNDQGAKLAVELGDFIDAAPEVATELGYLKAIEAKFAQFRGERHYVLGNHCVDTLTKQEFLGNTAMSAAHYSFDAGGFHFVILDSCYRGDGVAYGRNNSQWTDANVPAAELKWLADDLGKNDKPTIVFAHQRLDVAGKHAVRNAAEVRKRLEAAGNVLAVFQGHSHANQVQQIGGIHYCTLAAVVEGAGHQNNAYALMDLHADGTIRIDGFRKQQDYDWPSTD